MISCPRCGSADVHHSRLRSWIETLRVSVTGRAPFRCHHCDWRGWRREARPRSGAQIREIHHDLTDAELEKLDPE